jgi:hypothetical protein
MRLSLNDIFGDAIPFQRTHTEEQSNFWGCNLASLLQLERRC